MNALELLKQDHQKVAALFDEVKATDSEARQQKLFAQIKQELETHTHIEETVFYPKLMEHEDLRDIVLEGIEEHKQVKTLIREIERLVDGSEKFDAKLKVMSENVEHHVEEEETEMFPQVEEVMSAAQLQELGAQLQAAKSDYTKAAGVGR